MHFVKVKFSLVDNSESLETLIIQILLLYKDVVGGSCERVTAFRLRRRVRL
jgi:hypothetical protein